MNYKLTIGILLAILIVLIIGIMSAIPNMQKQETKLVMESSTSLSENESMSIKLTDLNENPVSNSSIVVMFKDQNGDVINKSGQTDNNGLCDISLNGLTPGNYTVTVIFDGNDKLKNSSLLTNLEIKQKVVEVQKSVSTSTSSSSDSIGPEVDSGGITREQAEYYGWTYTPEHGGHYIGSHDAWDEEAGVYHD
ncbi:MAG: Ig-like domain-containing protein [Methanobrevibacter sp.]|uniref:Ig-like domain-containing protein n=1 Tax=Methanobrevibacter sp. TaxID=66852 RepID=UPI0025EA2E5A|nr:Ig-like domain-containing protein [Methanobrevibacter sp.]MBR0271182.1 Ig-like domain-containing protein [Methanobrevibacter sp.]